MRIKYKTYFKLHLIYWLNRLFKRVWRIIACIQLYVLISGVPRISAWEGSRRR